MSVRWTMALSEELVQGGYAWYISTAQCEHGAWFQCFRNVLTSAHVLQLARRHTGVLHFERGA
jgi:hypothetical protein